MLETANYITYIWVVIRNAYP